MNVLLRSALGLLICAVCVVLAILALLHGLWWAALIALIAASLFGWAVYDNRQLMRSRAADTGPAAPASPPDVGGAVIDGTAQSQ